MARLFGPGQRSAVEFRRWSSRAADHVRSHFQNAAELAESKETVRRLEQENRRLSAKLAAVRSAPEASPAAADEEPLASRPGRVHVALLYVILGLLFVETILAWRFGHHTT